MKDYVIKIADIPPWRVALRVEADAYTAAAAVYAAAVAANVAATNAYTKAVYDAVSEDELTAAHVAAVSSKDDAIAAYAAVDHLPYAYIHPVTDEVKINVPITGIIAKIGNATASICRLTDDQYVWLMSLPQVIELGSGDPYIKEMNDITWIGSGLDLYHAIHLQDSKEVDDGEGGTMTITPPLLHCLLAS